MVRSASSHGERLMAPPILALRNDDIVEEPRWWEVGHDERLVVAGCLSPHHETIVRVVRTRNFCT